ncbi:MAG: hypothetical protein ACQET1_04970 [Gemmatimonadota bacterium]
MGASLHKELFDVVRFWDVAWMRWNLAAHLHWYNHARTHHALGDFRCLPTVTTAALRAAGAGTASTP